MVIDGGLPASSHTVIIDDLSDVFDGLMITLAMFTLNIFHPGIYLRDPTLSQTSPEEVILEDRLKTSPPVMKDRSSSLSRHTSAHAMSSTSANGPR